MDDNERKVRLTTLEESDIVKSQRQIAFEWLKFKNKILTLIVSAKQWFNGYFFAFICNIWLLNYFMSWLEYVQFLYFVNASLFYVSTK